MAAYQAALAYLHVQEALTARGMRPCPELTRAYVQACLDLGYDTLAIAGLTL